MILVRAKAKHIHADTTTVGIDKNHISDIIPNQLVEGSDVCWVRLAMISGSVYYVTQKTWEEFVKYTGRTIHMSVIDVV